MDEKAWEFQCKRCHEQHFLQPDAFDPKTMDSVSGVGCLCDSLYFANYTRDELKAVSVDSAIMAESKVKYVKPVPWE
jgi:hypothetical protein